MPRKPMPFQFDLFSSPCDPKIDQMPRWGALPIPMRQTLMLLIDHATSDPALASEEMRDDL